MKCQASPTAYFGPKFGPKHRDTRHHGVVSDLPRVGDNPEKTHKR
jgi:hypothetical protein